jgi:hypothetical protein
MTRITEVYHKGKSIYKMDFSNVNTAAEIQSIIREAAGHIRSKPANSMLTLTNIENMHFSNEIKELFNQFMKGNKNYVKAGTVVGLNPLQQMLYNSLVKLTGRNIKSFKTEAEAKDWLAGV